MKRGREQEKENAHDDAGNPSEGGGKKVIHQKKKGKKKCSVVVRSPIVTGQKKVKEL